MAPLFFNSYMYDLPCTIFRTIAYADELALLHSSETERIWRGLSSQDMTILLAYLHTWRLKLSHTKTITAAFHLNNQEAKHDLKVYNNNRFLTFCPNVFYCGVKLDRSLPFLSPTSGTAQKTIFACHTAEATCGLRTGADAKIQLPNLWSSQLLSTAHQAGVAVLTLASYSLHRPRVINQLFVGGCFVSFN